MRDLVLAVDIGTTAMKGGLIDSRGRLVAYHRLTYYEKTRQDYHSWDSQVWISALKDIVASLGHYEEISSVAVSGQGPTVVPVDLAGQPLFPALLWLDKRQLRREGSRSFYLPKIKWFQEHEPALYERTRWFLSCPEYLNYFLTGEARTVTPSTEFEPFIWAGADVAAYGLDPDRLPPFATTGEILGRVCSQAAYVLGLAAGLPVVAGGNDFLLALLGAGAVEPGLTCDRAGTSEGVNYCSAAPIDDPQLRVLPHVIPGLYNLSGILSSTGRLFEWYRRISGQTERSYRDLLLDLDTLPLDRSRPYFFPTFDAAGDFEFARGGFLELHPDHSREDLGRSIVESIGFGIRRILDRLGERGCPVSEIRVTGGQARNVVWNQMKADMTGRGVVVPEIEDAELLGCAVCALTAQGSFPDLSTASRSLFRVRSVYHPRPERAQIYESLYQDYQSYRGRVADQSTIM